MQTHLWADLHIDHLQALVRRGWFDTLDHYQQYISDTWIKHVRPTDVIILPGDIAISYNGLCKIKKLPGRKILVGGNHDGERGVSLSQLASTYDEIHGLLRHRAGFFISHAPLHLEGMRNRRNIHGHMHDDVIEDPRYINVSIDMCRNAPVSIDQIVSGDYTTYDRYNKVA